jgi:hypothetical protein
MSFEDQKFSLVVVENFGQAKRGQWWAFDGFVGALLVDDQEVGDGFNFDGSAEWAAFSEDYYREDSLGLDEGLICAGERGLGEAGGLELLLEILGVREGEVVDPVEKPRSGFVAHALAEAGGLGGFGEELGEQVVNDVLGAGLGLPGELVEGLGDS